MKTKEEVLKMSLVELRALVVARGGVSHDTRDDGYRVENGYVVDGRNNRAGIAYWGSEEKAKRSLGTLRDCTNCTNCTDCTNCTNCTNCKNCTNCTNCKNCMNCTNCTDCESSQNGLFCWNIDEGGDTSKYYIANVEVTEEEFETKRLEL